VQIKAIKQLALYVNYDGIRVNKKAPR